MISYPINLISWQILYVLYLLQNKTEPVQSFGIHCGFIGFLCSQLILHYYNIVQVANFNVQINLQKFAKNMPKFLVTYYSRLESAMFLNPNNTKVYKN